MALVVCVDLLNLACCAIEAARGLEQWRARLEQSDAFQVVEPGEPTVTEPTLSILVVAGTVTHSQAALVQQRFEALPEPRAVVAFGVCTISGGPYWDSYSVLPGIESLVAVDVMVPGCPPLPEDVAVALDEVTYAKLSVTPGSMAGAPVEESTKAAAHA